MLYCAEIILQPPTLLLRIVVVGALLAAIGVSVYWRGNGTTTRRKGLLAALRVASIAVLTLILFGPSTVRTASEDNFRRKFIIAMDTSASFSVRDVGEKTRFEAARQAWLDPALLDALRQRHDVRCYRYDEKLSPTHPGALWDLPTTEGRQTYIATAVTQLLETEFAQGGMPAGLLLVGDGHETGTGDPAAIGTTAARSGVPIWTACHGNVREGRDVALQTFSGQEFLFARQTGRLAAKIVQSGYDMAEVSVTLSREGKPVQDKTVNFRGRTSSDVIFDVREDLPGMYEYEIRVAPLPGETDNDNNARILFARVSNERIKVLLIEAQPYWDTKFLAQTLRADPQIDLTQIVRYGRQRFQIIRDVTAVDGSEKAGPNIDAALPRSRKDLFAYDVIILGKSITDYFNTEQLATLKDFLSERGGGIIFARGRAYDPATADGAAAATILAAIEPAQWADDYIRNLKMALTPEGREHPSFDYAGKLPPDVIMQELPGMIGAVKLQREKAAALILARSHGQSAEADPTGMAAIAYQNYGKGKVVAILNEGLWQWAMLPRPKEPLAELAPFDVFWRRMIRWMAGSGEFLPGHDVSLTVAQFPENLGDTTRIEVRLKYPPQDKPAVSLSVLGPDRQEQALALDASRYQAGLLAASFQPKQQGVYTVRLRTPDLTPLQQETRFCVYDYSIESIQTSADPAAMKELAESSGGTALDPRHPEELLSLLKDARPGEQERRIYDSIWDRPWVFAIIATLLTVEWFLRRRNGMP